ncbi:MAG: ATP-binding protein [Nitrospirae bacterium]|nr:ATP-binding protein [Nitrospirota bacterium]
MGLLLGTLPKNYLELLAEVFLFRYTDIFDYSVKKQIYNPSKIYCVDAALSSSIGFTFSQNKGHIYENIVYIELLRRKSDLYYWKSKKGKEVDFIIKKGLKATEAIQVCFSLDDEKTRQREFQALVEAKNDLETESLTVITDEEDGNVSVDRTEIKMIPLWKWLSLEP